MSIRVLLQPGDCFSIPLADGRMGFGQYICLPPGAGALIRIFDVISGDVVPVERLRIAGPLFPPIFVGLNPPVRMGRWRKIGNFPIENFTFPKFRSTFTHRKGVNHDWEIWNGQEYELIGDLPSEYRSLEYNCTYSYGDVEQRILTGENPFHQGVE